MPIICHCVHYYDCADMLYKDNGLKHNYRIILEVRRYPESCTPLWEQQRWMLPSPFLDATHCPGIVALSPIEQQAYVGSFGHPSSLPSHCSASWSGLQFCWQSDWGRKPGLVLMCSNSIHFCRHIIYSHRFQGWRWASSRTILPSGEGIPSEVKLNVSHTRTPWETEYVFLLTLTNQ